MYRRSGLAVLGVGALLTYLLIFIPFAAEVGRWVRTEDGAWKNATIDCPSAWGTLVAGQEPDVKYVFEAGACEKGANGRVIETVLVLAIALPLGIRGVMRGPRPPLEHIRPISELLGRVRVLRE